MVSGGRIKAAVAAFLVIASLAAPAGASEIPLDQPLPTVDPAMRNETPRAWFVELSSPPSSEGSSAATLKQEKKDFRENAKRQGVKFKERFEFNSLFNGLSIEAGPAEIAAISRMPGVKAVWPVISLPRPEAVEVDADPELYTALAMTGADVVQSELGYTGRDIKVAIMDTGIDYLHPDLGGCFGEGCRVVTGWDFVGDAYNADPDSPTYDPIPVPDPDPMDCHGHGTHVAGIVGANGQVKGVAPGVKFGAYRVFGCDGSTESDIMVAAMERALDDGMQILNMSIGSAFQWPQYPTAVAADRLVKKGMVVVASIGNSGANGIYSTGAPGLGTDVIGVASFDNTHISQMSFTISPDETAIGYGPASAAPTPPTSGSLPMARTGTPSSTADGCAPLPEGSLEGMAVLIQRGGCTFHTKALNAQNAGAAAVVLYNNGAGAFSPTVAGDPAITIPVVAILRQDGLTIDSRLAEGPVTLTWTDQEATVPNPTGGRISDFSSYGLAPDLSIKPDIGAPGGSIYSTYPLAQGGYATISGTSMAAPHVAGAAALLLEAKPKTKAKDVRTILQNSADPRNWWGNPDLGFLDNVHRQGAGLVQIDDAILATTAVEPSKIALGESEGGPATVTLTIRNYSADPVTYELSHAPALATGANTFVPSFWDDFAEVSFADSSLTIPGRATRKVRVTITAPEGPEGGLYGGYLVIAPSDGGQPVRVPYAGYVGDYQAREVLTAGDYGFPWLASLSDGFFQQQESGATFTMQDGDVPYVLLHLDHHARKLVLEVEEAATGESWHTAYAEEYLPRNSTPGGFFAFAFDGVTTRGNGKGNKTYEVPDGEYVLKVKVLKALGDERNPEHWETWTSPSFIIDRP